MNLLIDTLPETSVVSIGHRPGLEAFHNRELTLVPGEEGAKLTARVGARSLVDVYRKMSAASRTTPPDTGFWTALRTSLLGAYPLPRNTEEVLPKGREKMPR